MSISDVIRERIKNSGGSFFCNDNISAFIEDGDMKLLQDEVEEKMESLLRSLVIDIDHDHNTHDTARRVAKMYINEIFEGRYIPPPKVTSFPNMGYRNLYVAGPISIKSTCAHHFQNIKGSCWVGIFPDQEVIGLSKFNRIIHWITHRPQIQEEMTTQIADKLVEFAKTGNVAVVLKAEHMCLTHRGVREHESDMTTAVMRGEFQTNTSLKDEYYTLVSNMKGYQS